MFKLMSRSLSTDTGLTNREDLSKPVSE